MPAPRPIAVLAALTLLAACAGSTVSSGAQEDGAGAGSTQPALSAPGVTAGGEGPTAAESAATQTTASTSSGTASTTSIAPTTDTVSATTPATTPATIVALAGWDAVDHYLDIAVVRGGSQAVSAAVMRDGARLHDVSLGMRVDGEPISPDDRLRVASISKTITAITVLRLVEDGVFALDTPVGASIAAHLGVGGVPGVADITVRHLLTHRSGLGQYEDLFFRRQVESCPEAAVVGLTRRLSGVPGTTFRYSNLNFCLLGILIEQATGQPYESVVEAQLLAPLGIDRMRLAGTVDVGPDDVEHASAEGRNYMEVLGAAGAWIATPGDLVTILDSLDLTTPGWKPLQPATVAEMMTITVDPPVDEPLVDEPLVPDTPPTTVPAPPESGYGMGLMIFGPGAYGHTGTVESTHAMFVHRPDGITWAVAVSGDYPSSTRQLARIMDNALLLGGFTDGTYVAIPPPLDLD